MAAAKKKAARKSRKSAKKKPVKRARKARRVGKTAARRGSPLSPGKEMFLKDATDLAPDTFRRLVSRRARQIVGAEVGPVDTETERRALEAEIDLHFEAIHKGADFLPASFLQDGSTRARSVCRVSTPTSFGTGFLVAPGILMTNNHVLRSARTAAESVAEFGLENGQNPSLAAIQPERLFITDRALDFTIVACEETATAELQPIPLLRNPATVTRNERVNIIQHPRGRPKEVALHDNKVSRILDRVIRYETDTEPGSSGSPVFNNGWDLVALHHAGVRNQDGSATNEGIRLSAIVAHLLNRTEQPSSESAAFEEMLRSISDTSPYLGFFDTHGVGEAGSLEVEVPDFVGTPDFADVGIWNIEHFNNQISDQRVEDVAEVVARLSMDVFGLSEVQEGALDRLVAALGTRGFAMGFELLNVPGAQDLAVLFDRETTTVRLRTDLGQRFRPRLDARTAAGKTAFPRHPLFAECTVGNEGVRFLMLLVHLKAFGDAQSRARRRLAAQILAEIIEDIREREGMPVVLGGDFNERLDNDVLAALKAAPDLAKLTADDATNDAISYVGQRHRSLIDHIIVSNDVRLGEISSDDAAIVRLDRSVRDFSERVSDHVPIVIRMVLRDQPLDIDAPSRDETVRLGVPEGARSLQLQFAGP